VSTLPQGAIFQGLMKMRPRCPSCDLLFDREPGYFLGAMMISYALSVICYVLIYQLLKAATDQSFHWLLIEMVLLYLPLVPFVFRYSRILWIYFDQTLDPGR